MGKFKDLTGMKFGRLIVIERAIELEQERLKHGKRKDTYWICECECGNKKIKPKRGTDLKLGKVLSCGCIRNEAIRVYASNMSNGGNSILDYIKANNLEHRIDWEKNESENIDLSMIAKKSNIKIWVKCDNFSEHPSYKVSCHNFSSGSGCPYCSGIKVCKVTSIGWLYPRVLSIWSDNNTKSPYECTPGNNTKKILFKCCDCGEEYKRSAYESVKVNFRCPKCNKRSLGEQKIFEILSDKGLYVLEQHRFKDCKYKNTLPFDFYIPNKNACVEYDGEQHFTPVKFNGISYDKAKQLFESNKIRDKIKTEYCEKHKIRLIRIPYWEFENTENILIKELNLVN